MGILWGEHQKPTNGICFITCLDAFAFVCSVYACTYVWVRGCAVGVHFYLDLNVVEYRRIMLRLLRNELIGQYTCVRWGSTHSEFPPIGARWYIIKETWKIRNGIINKK